MIGALVRRLFPPRREPLPDSVLVFSSLGCQHCGSGILKVLTRERRLRCAQCVALDLELTQSQVEEFARDHAWQPAQSGRAGL